MEPLGALCRDARGYPERLPCEALAIRRADRSIMLPDPDCRVEAGDEILFCGIQWVEHVLQATLHNPYTLQYVVTGFDVPRGYVFTWLQGEHAISTRRSH